MTLWCATIPVADCSQTLLAGIDAEESNCRMIRGEKVVLHPGSTVYLPDGRSGNIVDWMRDKQFWVRIVG